MSLKPFESLYRHFVIATAKARPAIQAKHLLNQEITYEQIQDEVYQAAEKEQESMNPLFKNFCDAGKAFIEQKGTQEQQSNVVRKYEQAISDYLLLRKAAATELHIMELNRVGVDKDLSNIIKQTARHVGLEMPKAWQDSVKDPFDHRNKQ